MRAHSDEEIINKASQKEKTVDLIKDNKIDVAVDLDDQDGTCHTYVVTFLKDDEKNWTPFEVNELSSL